MSRWMQWVWGVVGAVAWGCQGFSTATAQNSDSASFPNVVFLVSDDQAWTDYGFMGHPHIRTPRLDRLASESLLFTRGYVPNSLCRPSLATMLTGLYPHQHGIVGNDPALPAGAMKDKARTDPKYVPLYEALISNIETHPTLPHLLKERGYESLQTGKWWEGQPSRGGFTQAMTHGDPERGGRHGDVGLEVGRKGLGPIPRFLQECQAENKPFFLWYAPFLPHTPHNPPERLLEKYRPLAPTEPVAKYWAMCEWFDETCGQVLDLINENGLRDNTIVVYVCDNGWINLPDQSAYAPKSKRSQYDGGVRTPLMIRWPGKIAPRREEKILASSIDIAPTVLRACGLEPTADMAGIDWRDEKAMAGRKRVFGEIFEHDVVDVKVPAASLRYRWMIEGDWKLIVPDARRMPGEPVELYDLSADPAETRNLAAAHPERVKQLRQALDAWWSGE